MSFILETNQRLPLAGLSIVFRTGGISDPVGQDGLFRLMLRALRRGSEGLSAQQFESAIDALGAEVGVEVYTTSAVLTAQVVSRNFDKLIELLARLLSRPTFPEDELRKLQDESTAELVELRDNDRELCNLAFRRTLFGKHPFARLAAGRISSLKTLTRKHVLEAHARCITRDGVFFGFVGDVSEEKARDAVATLVASLPAGTASLPSVPETQQAPKRHLVFVDKPERSQTQVLIGRLGTHPKDADHTALTVANSAFGGTFTARLMKEVRSKRGWSYGAYSRLNVERARHSYTMWTFPAAETTAECVALELKMLDTFYKNGITERELKFFQKYMARSYAFDIDTPAKRIGQALDVTSLELPADYYTHFRERVLAVTLDEANAAIRARLSPTDLVIAVVGTQETLLADLEKAIPDLASTTVMAHDAD
jgi:zinc protease